MEGLETPAHDLPTLTFPEMCPPALSTNILAEMSPPALSTNIFPEMSQAALSTNIFPDMSHEAALPTLGQSQSHRLRVVKIFIFHFIFISIIMLLPLKIIIFLEGHFTVFIFFMGIIIGIMVVDSRQWITADHTCQHHQRPAQWEWLVNTGCSASYVYYTFYIYSFHFSICYYTSFLFMSMYDSMIYDSHIYIYIRKLQLKKVGLHILHYYTITPDCSSHLQNQPPKPQWI